MNQVPSDKLFAPAFRYQRLGWLFTVIVAIMVYIATFAMAAEAALSSMSLSRGENLRNHLTIEIPAVDDESATPQAERVRQALSVLRAMPGVENAEALSDADTARLLKPWIDDADLLKRLPLPTLISVARRGGETPSADDIGEKLEPVIRDARVDDHAAWLDDFSHFIGSLVLLAGFMIVLTGFALIISISLICRAVMATERDTVELLHIMGASDATIASHFQHHAWRLAFPAAIAGFLLAALSLGALMLALRHVIDPAALPMMRWAAIGLLLILVPLAAIATAVLSARLTVAKFLQPAS
jgi:cell division transport system permease protein